MCLSTSNVRSTVQWNWEGDLIVHNPIIPAMRKVPGTGKRYDIDIRGYISNRDNAVIKRAVDEIAAGLGDPEKEFFHSRREGSFDFRVRKATEYLAKRVRYAKGSRTFDYWLFPEETLTKENGDCEDRAFLLASLLLSSGVSSYVVRVVLGKLYNQRTRESHDHVWVMYKNESGVWMLIEPLLHSERGRKRGQALRRLPAPAKTDTYEYVPYYVFNDDHLWSLKSNTGDKSFLDYLKSRSFWAEFDPEFAASVHNHLFDLALDGLSWSDLLYAKGVSLAMDINPATYDPRDHFDNGYIEESWERLLGNLTGKTLDGLAMACHTIADFYAHSSYAHFARKDGAGHLLLFDGVTTDDRFAVIPDYGRPDFDLHDAARFTVNKGMCTLTPEETIAYCNGRKLISGRFAQPGDPYQGTLEKLFISIPYELRHRPDFKDRTCLPHHNEIAVDSDLDSGGNIPSGHRLYGDPGTYSSQFRLRLRAATDHMRQFYGVWKS